MISYSPSPFPGTDPVARVIAVIPRAQMSIPNPYSPSVNISGAIQFGVPTNVSHFDLASLNSADTPKSPILISPRSVSRIFAGLTSRCILPVSCKYLSPFNISQMMTETNTSSTFPRLDRISLRLPPLQNSMTMNSFI